MYVIPASQVFLLFPSFALGSWKSCCESTSSCPINFFLLSSPSVEGLVLRQSDRLFRRRLLRIFFVRPIPEAEPGPLLIGGGTTKSGMVSDTTINSKCVQEVGRLFVLDATNAAIIKTFNRLPGKLLGLRRMSHAT